MNLPARMMAERLSRPSRPMIDRPRCPDPPVIFFRLLPLPLRQSTRSRFPPLKSRLSPASRYPARWLATADPRVALWPTVRGPSPCRRRSSLAGLFPGSSGLTTFRRSRAGIFRPIRRGTCLEVRKPVRFPSGKKCRGHCATLFPGSHRPACYVVCRRKAPSDTSVAENVARCPRLPVQFRFCNLARPSHTWS